MNRRRTRTLNRNFKVLGCVAGGVLAASAPAAVQAATVANPLCPNNTAFFSPGNGEDIVVPPGFRVSRDCVS